MPRIFMSSTVLDFEDMRGALRDWLQTKGFDVLASDATDFNKGGDANSYRIARSPIAGQDEGLQEEEVLPTDVHGFLAPVLPRS
jgi:hypothetical protein